GTEDKDHQRHDLHEKHRNAQQWQQYEPVERQVAQEDGNGGERIGGRQTELRCQIISVLAEPSNGAGLDAGVARIIGWSDKTAPNGWVALALDPCRKPAADITTA